MNNRLAWVSVNDGFPDKGDTVLVTDGKGSIQQYNYFGSHTVESAAYWGSNAGSPYWKRVHDPMVGTWIDDNSITHWLPLSALVATLPTDDKTIKLDSVQQIQIGGNGNVQTIS